MKFNYRSIWFTSLVTVIIILSSFTAVFYVFSTLGKANKQLNNNVLAVIIDTTRTAGFDLIFQRTMKDYIAAPSEENEKELVHWLKVLNSRILLVLPEHFVAHIPENSVSSLREEVAYFKATLDDLNALIVSKKSSERNKKLQEYAESIEMNIAYFTTKISSGTAEIRNKQRIALDKLSVSIIILSTILILTMITMVFFVIRIQVHKKELQDLSTTDALTTLGNRRKFDQIYKVLFENSARKNSGLSFFIVDVDNFKKFNDTYGHQLGDDALQKVAKAMKSALKRASDDCFRLGREEFGCLVVTDSENKKIEIANRIRESVEKLGIPHALNAPFQVLTISVGCASLNDTNYKNLDEMYAAADQKLYIAKENGRNRIAY